MAVSARTSIEAPSCEPSAFRPARASDGGLEAAPDDSYSRAWRALYEPTSIRPWERPGVPDGAKQRALNAYLVDRERRATVMRRAMGWT